MSSHWFLAISVSHVDCPLFHRGRRGTSDASFIFELFVSISQGQEYSWDLT